MDKSYGIELLDLVKEIKQNPDVNLQMLADAMKISYPALRGMIYRAQKGTDRTGEVGSPGLFDPLAELPPPLHDLSGDFIIIGDVHVPSTDYEFAQLPVMIAKKHLKKPRKLIIAGDWWNMDTFSCYPEIVKSVTFQQEAKASEHLMKILCEAFDEIYYIMGNHDRRIERFSRGQITPGMLMKERGNVTISEWGHCIVNNTWRVTHSSNYSVNQLVVADQLAQKYQMNIIAHHSHQFAIGTDRYGRYTIINNGGLFDPGKLIYAILDDNKSPAMIPGFTMLKNGYPYLFGKIGMFTDWDRWL